MTNILKEIGIILRVLSFDNGDTIINPCDIFKTFNNWFASLGETIKKGSLHKHFSDYLSNESDSTVFPQATYW